MKKPNIILISIDTLRADHLSCYGYHKRTTPNIDRLSEEAVICRNNLSTGVWTPPGHASMLTGLYVSEHGVFDTRKLNDYIPTIASELKAQGYQTAGFVNNSQVGALVGLDKGHDIFEEVWKGIEARNIIERAVKGTFRRIRRKVGYEDMGAKRTNTLFRNWIETSLDKARPFYCFLHYIEPHNPLDPPRGVGRDFVEPSLGGLRLEMIKKIAQNPLICYVEDIVPNENEIRYLKSLYDGEVAYTDQRVGEIIETLQRNGLYEDTMIIITADHGEHFGEHGFWSHVASLYREVVRIPLIIKFPGEYRCTAEVQSITQLVDIFPTVLEVTENPNKDIYQGSGVVLLPEEGQWKEFHDCAFAEWEGRVPYFILEKIRGREEFIDLSRFKTPMMMVQDKKYKLIWKSEQDYELYDIHNDPCENVNISSNLYAFGHMNDKRVKAKEKMKIRKGEQTTRDEQVERNLKALGYM